MDAGASTPQVSTVVPKPIATALAEDTYGGHAFKDWPGPALGYKKAALQERLAGWKVA